MTGKMTLPRPPEAPGLTVGHCRGQVGWVWLDRGPCGDCPAPRG